MAQKFDVYICDHTEATIKAHGLRTAANSAAYLLNSLLPDMKICDIGCGPGSITIDLATLVPKGQVIGVDMGHDAVEKARSVAAERGVKNVNFQVADAYSLDFPDHSFDVVHCHQVLLHLANPVKALREWRRVTKPGGIVACCEADMGSTIIYPEIKALTDYKDAFERMARSRGSEPHGGRHLVAWARESGIDRSCITATVKAWCFSSPEERAHWSSQWVDRLRTSSMSKNAIDGGFATQEDIGRFIEGWREWGADEDGWYTLTVGEILARV